MKRQFKEYRVKLTVRACVLYEMISGKSFFEFGNQDTTDENAMQLMYSTLIANNDLTITFDTFKVLYGDNDFQKWMDNEFMNAMRFNEQFTNCELDETNEEPPVEEGFKEKATMTNVMASLIGQHGIDADYVMNKMYLFEIREYFNALDIKEKSRLVENRLWTYLTIAPHIDTKKINSPEKLLPFAWERPERERQQLDELKRHKEEAKAIIGMDMSCFFRPPEKKEEVEND